jgi:cyclophilin family peptidyl-prolyl cis-trans isomerase
MRSRIQIPTRLAWGLLTIAFASACPQESETASTGAPEPAPTTVAAVPEGPVGIEAIDEFIAQQTIDKTDPRWKTKLPKPPKVAFDDRTYYWDLDTTVGRVSIRLMPEVAPMHVSSTIYLTQLGFYDGTLFHRVIPAFMAQGGDPLGNGRGNPGYRYDGEFSKAAVHDRPGLLSMANAGPGTDGSQFFLTFVATPHLDGRHTIFGEVVEGMDAVKQLEVWRQRGSEHLNEKLEIEKAEVRAE